MLSDADNAQKCRHNVHTTSVSGTLHARIVIGNFFEVEN